MAKEIYILYDIFAIETIEFFKSYNLANKRRNEWVNELKDSYISITKKYGEYPETLEIECEHSSGHSNNYYRIKKISGDNLKEVKFSK